jgi:hypothetical protein
MKCQRGMKTCRRFDDFVPVAIESKLIQAGVRLQTQFCDGNSLESLQKHTYKPLNNGMPQSCCSAIYKECCTRA